MPPRKTSTASPPSSPPAVINPAPIIKRRKLPDFMTLSCAKKRIRFDDVPFKLEPLDPILEETDRDVTAESG
jgi:hypothetical protein